ncbi:MAG: cytidylyltransferase domain-containing protein [Phenylobacterium sp.]|jgi:spore coat polysaccharide biosynthesis protein SpsF|uniref:cytidylyltransferase domain-containing protein n=1 Tax=Phenylobacterium sp. TaxID=1871053 RepID=UPI00391AC904
MILAILQARMTSPRAPGKAMAPLRGEPMVWRQVERIRQARCVSKVVVATSSDPADDPLAAYLVSRGQTVFRGASANLTERFVRCIEAAGPVSHVVRIKGDSPFVDPGVIDEAARLALASRADYAGNRLRRTFPRGLEVEVATAAALFAVAAETPPEVAACASPMGLIRAQPERFPQTGFVAVRDYSALDWRVKTPADYAFARAVYDALHPADPGFGLHDVLDILQGRQDLARWAA